MKSLSKRVSVSAISAAAAAALLGSCANVAHGQAANVNGTWQPVGGGNWNVGSNWNTNPNYPNAVGASATFNTGQTAIRTVDLVEAVTLGALTITNNTNFRQDITDLGGGFITFDAAGAGPAVITVNGTTTQQNRLNSVTTLNDNTVINLTSTAATGTAGSWLFGGPMNGPGGLTKTGPGRMTLANTPGEVLLFKDYEGPTEFNDGRTRLSLDGRPRFTSAAAIIGNGQIEPISTGNFTFGLERLNLPTPLPLPTLTLQGNGPVAGPDANSFGTIRPSANLDVEFDNPINLPTAGQVAVVHSRKTAAGPGSLKFDGQISGPGGIQFSQAIGDANFGTYFITNAANNYTGSTIVYGGTVDSTAGKLGTGPLTVNVQPSGGAASLVLLNTSSANTVGTLSGNRNGLSSTINNGGQLLTVNQTADGTYDGVITGAGGLALGASSTNKLTLSGAVNYTGPTSVAGGTLAITQGFKNLNSLTVTGGKAEVPATTPDTFNPPATVPAGTNAAGSKVSSLSVSGTGQLDLNNNDMIIDHDGSLDIADIRDLIASGYNFGGQDGPGIISTTAANTDPFTFTLGYADNASLPLPYGTVIGTGAPFAGFDVDDTAALIKFTWVGDVTLDGIFDFQDLSIFNGNYDAGATTGRVWTDGDLNFDGTIDFQDLSLFNGNYDPSKPSLPEPGALGALGLLALGLGRRRRQAAR